MYQPCSSSLAQAEPRALGPDPKQRQGVVREAADVPHLKLLLNKLANQRVEAAGGQEVVDVGVGGAPDRANRHSRAKQHRTMALAEPGSLGLKGTVLQRLNSRKKHNLH